MSLKVQRNLPRIDPRVFQAIREKAKETNPKITDRAIYGRIESVRERHQKSISARMAANILAAENGIDIHRYLRENASELNELRQLLAIKPLQSSGEIKKDRKEVKDQPIVISRKIVDAFGLPQNLGQEANRMAEVYPDLYVFENLLRYIVIKVLEKKHGRDWWIISNVIPTQIAKKVVDRKNKEGINRWHSERGSHEIFYSDFGDLSAIVSMNWSEFKSVFPSLRWIQTRLEETELSRNIIAHSNPLPKKECDRIKLFLDDLKRQLDIRSQ